MRAIPVIVSTVLASVVAVIVGSVVSVLSSVTLALPAHADPVEATDSDPYVSRIVPLSGPRIRVTMSDGYTVKLNPCRYEDGRRCYWVGSFHGNGVGRSFVVVRGIVYGVTLYPSDAR